MKKISLALALVLLVMGASAQRRDYNREGKTKFGIGPAIGWATHNPFSGVPGNKGYGLGIGGILQVEHFFQQTLSGVAQAGILSYGGRSSGTNTKNKAYTAIPIMVGGNFYLNDLHIGALIGAGFNSLSGSSATTFAYSPQIGYNFSRNDFPLDFTVSYDGYAGHGGFSALMARLSLFF